MPYKAQINSMLHADATSVHNNVTWGSVSGLSGQILALTYYLHNYIDVADAKNAPSTDWLTSLPTSVDFTHESRHLWVKAVPSAKFIFDNPYLDVTATSQIQKIISLVDAQPNFSTFKLSSAVTFKKNADFDTPLLSKVYQLVQQHSIGSKIKPILRKCSLRTGLRPLSLITNFILLTLF